MSPSQMDGRKLEHNATRPGRAGNRAKARRWQGSRGRNGPVTVRQVEPERATTAPPPLPYLLDQQAIYSGTCRGCRWRFPVMAKVIRFGRWSFHVECWAAKRRAREAEIAKWEGPLDG